MRPAGSKGMRVLLAGRDRAFLEGLGEDMRSGRDDVTVEVATDPRDVREALDDGGVAALMCQEDVGGGSGADLLADAAARDPGLVTVLVTERDSDLAAGTVLDAGISDNLPKAAVAERPEAVLDRLASAVADRGGSAYRDLFEKAADGIFLHDPETGEIIDANPRACEMTGHPWEDLVGSTVGRFSATDNGYTEERAAERITSAAETGRQVFEWKNERPDGSAYWCEINLRRTTIGGEERVLAIARDITDRKRAERRHRETFEHVADGLVLHEIESGEILDVNGRYCELTGYGRDELIGADVGLVSAGGEYTYERAHRLIERAATEGPQLFEWRNERPDGSTVPVEVHLAVVEIGEGRRVLASVRDIRERKRAERALRRSEERLRTITERIDQVVYLASPDMREVHHLSSGYEEIWGRPVDELDEDPFAFIEGIHPDDRDRYAEKLDAMLDDLSARSGDRVEDVYEFSFRVQRPDGEVRWVEVAAYPVTDDGGSVKRLAGIIEDATDQVKRERSLESFQEATRQLSAAHSLADASATAIQAAESVFGFPRASVHLYEESAGGLVPAAATSGLEVDDLPLVEPVDRAWQVFADGDPVRATRAGDRTIVGPDREAEELVLPLGAHGVLVVAAPAGEGFDTDDVESAQILAARLEAGLNHVEGEREIARRERALEAESSRADRLDRLNAVIRDVQQSLIDESTREGVEASVCERLTAGDAYALAWIGRRSATDGSLTVVNRRGDEGDRGSPVDVIVDGSTVESHPAWRAIETGETRVVDSLVEERSRAEWRTAALTHGYQSCCAVPLSDDGIVHGVLMLYGDEPHGFDERERRVLTELGRSIGYAISTIERRRALESDTTVELELAIGDDRLYVSDLARRTGGRVTHERAVRNADGRVRLFCTVTGADEGAMDRVVGGSAGREIRAIANHDDGTLLQVTTGDWFGSIVTDSGGSVRTARASDDGATVSVELPGAVDTRRVVERLRSEYESVELRAKLESKGSRRTARDLRDRLERELTDRQREALETAFAAGYFEWPRESSGEDVADLLGIAQPTFNRHLRKAEERTFSIVLDA